MTQDYKTLYKKAVILADFCDYILKVNAGTFMFYDSPSFHSFIFKVDPETFSRGDVTYFLYKKFEERMFYD